MIGTTILSIALLLGYSSGQERIKPPKVGKFFYVDFPTFGTHGQHQIKLKVPNRDQETFDEYPLYITT